MLDPRLAGLARLLQLELADHHRHRPSGDYSFTGLAAGDYAVIEIEPGGYLDGLTTPGTTGGVVIGPYNATPAAVLAGLTVPTPANAIMGIQITAGQTSASNNFSVVETQVIYLIQPLPPAGPAAVAANIYSQYQPVVVPVAQFPQLGAPNMYIRVEPGARIQLAPERGQCRPAPFDHGLRTTW